MKSKRELKHPEYYKLKAYQILAKIADEEMAKILGIATRTYRDKRKGYSDFTPAEAIVVSKVLDKPQSEIFLV